MKKTAMRIVADALKADGWVAFNRLQDRLVHRDGFLVQVAEAPNGTATATCVGRDEELARRVFGDDAG